MKTCTKCKKERDITYFYKSKSKKNGIHTICKECANKNWKKYSLKNDFGITVEEYEEMLTKQDSRCAICGSYNLSYMGRKLTVDHDHVTGKIRGLLCSKCNLGLGCMKDNPQILHNAIDYLSKR